MASSAIPSRVLVLGGGICGLAAADEILRLRSAIPSISRSSQQSSLVVMEKESVIGGLLTTDHRRGFYFDRGGHRFITALPWVLERVQQICKGHLFLRERNSLVLFDGTPVRYPLEFVDLLRKLGPWQNARALGSYLYSSPKRWLRRSAIKESVPPQTLANWLQLNFGTYLYHKVFENYSRKLWGASPEELVADWAPQRISIPNLGGYLRQLLFQSQRPSRTYAKRYLYPQFGIGEIPNCFADAVKLQGGEIRTSCDVLQVRRESDCWHIKFSDAEGRIQDQVFDAIISTIPLKSLVGMFSKDLKIQRSPLQNLDNLKYRGLRFLNLGFDRPVPLDATWLYQPDANCRFTRIQVPAARSLGMVPSGCGSIQLEEPVTDAQADYSDLDTRLHEAQQLLDPLGLWPSDPILSFDSFAPFAYPVYQGQSREIASQARESLEQLPYLRIAGRQGCFNYIFFDRAIVEGVNASRSLFGCEPLPKVADQGERPILLEAESLL